MASEITDQDQAASPSNQEELLGNGNAAGEQGGPENRGIKRQRTSTAGADDDDDDDDKPGRERRKIEIKFIQDKSRRHITFSKRKAGIMKKVGQHHQLLRDLTRSSSIDIPMWHVLIAIDAGVRIVCPHRHASPSSCRLRDRFGLHVHHTEASTTGHQARRKEPHPGLLPTIALQDPRV